MLELFKKSYSEKELNLFSFLSKNKLFEKLTHEELNLFLPYMYKRHYKENEVVFFSNDPSHALYLTKTGIVSLNIDLKESFEKIGVLRSGNIFGENALVENTKRLYTAIVVSEKAELYVIPQINLLQIMDDNEQIRAKLMTSLAETNDQYMQNLFKTYKSAFGFFDLSMVYSKS